MPPWPHPLFARVEAALRRPLLHLLLLLAAVLAMHGHALSFGLLYDDRPLLQADHARWLHAAWEYQGWFRPGEFVGYYRPLQALLFDPRVVSSVPAVLHLENLIAGTVIVFLFGQVLRALGLGLWLSTSAEIVAVILPTSLALFAWISQRTDWPACGLGLALVLLTWRSRVPLAGYLGGFVALGAGALFAKESGAALLVLAPLLLALRGRRRDAALAAAAGIALFAGYAWLRSAFVPESGLLSRSPAVLAGRLVLGLMEVFLFSWLPACFTSNALILGSGVIFGACAFMGFAAMWRRQRPAAVVLVAIFVAYGLGTALHPVPRNLAIPGMVVGAFACAGGARLLEVDAERGRKGLEILLLVASLASLAGLSRFSSYALQDWIEPINDRLERGGYTGGRGLVHPIDMNTPLPGLAPEPSSPPPSATTRSPDSTSRAR